MDEFDQSGRGPGTFANIPIQFNEPFDAVRGDAAADNNIISKTFGIRFMHWMCIPDPLYQVKVGDVRQSFNHEDNQQFIDSDKFQQENGFLYICKGPLYGVFTSNKKDFRNVVAGLYGDAGAMISINRYYENSDEYVKISENDKLIPCELSKEFFSTNWQKFTHNPTGIDRLEFRACEVQFLIDSRGVFYKNGVDYTLTDGYIKWNEGQGTDRPGLDPLTGVGRVCSIRYTYKPYYYVKTALHDIRIRPGFANDGSGDITAQAGPILALVQADWIYLDRRTADDKATDAVVEEGTGENTGPR